MLASTTLQNSTPKLAGQTPESISQEAVYHGILAMTSLRYQAVEKLLLKQSEDASQNSSLNQMSHPNVPISSSDPFSTVPHIVNAGDWGCTVCDLETIIVLILLAFNFIPQRSQHSLTFKRSRLRDPVTVTLNPGDGTIAIKVESSA